MDQLCDFCETKMATIRCLHCKKSSILCDACFALKHSTDAMKGHKMEPYTGTKPSKSESVTPSESLCTMHQQERRYVCLQDNVTVCQDCLIIGPHKHHDAMLLKDSEKMVNEKFGGLIKGCEAVIGKTNNILKLTESGKLAISNSHAKAKLIISNAFKIAHEKLVKKEKDVQAALEKKCISPDSPFFSAEASANEMKGKMTNTINEFGLALKYANLPDGFDKLYKMQIPDLIEINKNLDNIDEKVKSTDGKIKEPRISFDVFDAGIDLMVTLENSEQVNSKIRNLLEYMKEENKAEEKLIKMNEKAERMEKEINGIKSKYEMNECEICKEIICKRCYKAKCKKCCKIICTNCYKQCSECKIIFCLECNNNLVCHNCKLNISINQLHPTTNRIYTVYTNYGNFQTICYYDLNTKKCIKTNIQNTYERASCLQIEFKIFIIGGYNNSGVYVNNMNEYIEQNNTLITRTSMKNTRYYMGLCKITNNTFCVIGGDNGSAAIKACEMYDISNDSWKNIPDLNSARYYCGCTLFNQNIIYCFGGYDNKNYLNTVESLDISKEGNNWINVALNLNESNGANGPCLFKINESTILIFRGHSSNEVYEFDVKSMQIKPSKTITAISDYFREIPYKIGDMVYFGGYHTTFHTYNLKTGIYCASSAK